MTKRKPPRVRAPLQPATVQFTADFSQALDLEALLLWSVRLARVRLSVGSPS